MNTTTTTINTECLNAKDGISIAAGIIGLLLIISEALPYFKPKENYNGLLQSIQNILQEQLKKQNPSSQNLSDIN
jgi:hypothetical protein